MEKQAVYAYINIIPYWDNVQLSHLKCVTIVHNLSERTRKCALYI